METFAIPFLIFVGSLLAVQAAANVQLSAAVGSPFGASTLQLGIGAAVLLVVAVPVGALGAFDVLGEARAWHLIGGIGSAVYITAGILLFPRLGAVVSVGLFIAGQMLASVILDGSGWLGVERQPIDAAAIAGTIAVITAAFMIVRAQAGAEALESAVRDRLGWIVLGRRRPPDAGHNQCAAAGGPRRATRRRHLLVRGGDGRDGDRPDHRADRGAGTPAADARRGDPPVVGLARRHGRGDLCDVDLPADPRDRRRADDRPDGRRPAARIVAR